MDMKMGEEYEDRVQEIVNDLEESGKELEADNSPSREVKEELIEMEMARGNKTTGDGKLSSDSGEEGERIVIDNSIQGESFMVRTMKQEKEDEPAPPRDLMTPILESTPCEGHESEGRKSRPLTAPKKKLWVQPEPKEGETEEEEDRKSSSGESETRRSPMSVISSGRITVVENEIPLHVREPRGYGDRATRTHVRFNDRTGLREISTAVGEHEMLTGGGEGKGISG